MNYEQLIPIRMVCQIPQLKTALTQQVGEQKHL